MIRKLIIFNILLVLIFQPASHAFSSLVLMPDHEPVSFSIELSSEHDEPDGNDSNTSNHVGHSNHNNCEMKYPIGMPLSQILNCDATTSYNELTNASYLFIPLDTLLRPPRNS